MNIFDLEKIKQEKERQKQEQEEAQEREWKRQFIRNWFGEAFLKRVEDEFPDIRLFLVGKPKHSLEIEAKRIYNAKNPSEEQDNFDPIAYNRDNSERWRNYFSEKLSIKLDPIEETEEQSQIRSKDLQMKLLAMIEDAKKCKPLVPKENVITFRDQDAAASAEVGLPV